MSGGLLLRLTTLAARYPLPAAVILIGFGAFMMRDSILDGTEKAAFLDGPQVVGTVVELRGKTSLPAKYEMIATWPHPNRQTHSGVVFLFKNDFERLRKGSRIELLLARDDYGKALVAAHMESNEPIRVLGVTATPMVFVGLVFVLIGIFFRPIARRLEVELGGGA